jgi:Rrf2 family nitric oxide-sensitive transcriptional repressor
LTVYTDYALRLLMYLAVKEDGLTKIADVAASYGISKNHLSKVAYQLGIAGYVETIRGRKGGLRLARPAADIRIGDVIRHAEPDMAIVPCFGPVDAFCAIEPCCVLRGALARAEEAFIEALNGYSLADLARPRSPLRSMLAIAPSVGPRANGRGPRKAERDTRLTRIENGDDERR